jgi:hypothetical protein
VWSVCSSILVHLVYSFKLTMVSLLSCVPSHLIFPILHCQHYLSVTRSHFHGSLFVFHVKYFISLVVMITWLVEAVATMFDMLVLCILTASVMFYNCHYVGCWLQAECWYTRCFICVMSFVFQFVFTLLVPEEHLNFHFVSCVCGVVVSVFACGFKDFGWSLCGFCHFQGSSHTFS